MTVVAFSNEDFASLVFEEFPSQWNSVGLNELDGRGQETITSFIGSVTGKPAEYKEDGSIAYEGFEIDWDNILLVKAAEGGVLDRVYGAALYKDETGTGMVIVLGKNRFPVAIEESERTVGSRKIKEQIFMAGSLIGNLAFEEKSIKLKTSKEEEFDYTPVVLEMTCSESDITYKITVRSDSDAKPTADRLRAAVKNNSLVDLLQAPKTGGEGGSAVKMQDLGIGEYLVTGYRETTGQYGVNWVLKLGDGREVWSRGNASTQLKDPLSREVIDNAIGKGDPLTLAVTSISDRGNGKFQVGCAFRMRAPIASKEVKPVDRTSEKRELAMAAASISSTFNGETTEQKDFSDIPF